MTRDLSVHYRDYTILFVGGLHGSGTSALAKSLGTHPHVSQLTNTFVPEDEGQHLQSLFPPASALGGRGRWAFNPAAHMTQGPAVPAKDAAEQLFEAWRPYWDLDASVLIEKSPPNMLRMRFLESIFPEAKFLIIVRHPIAVSLATLQRRRSLCVVGGVSGLLDHWLAAYGRMAEDLRYLKWAKVLRYEDLVDQPGRMLGDVADAIGVSPDEFTPSFRRDINDRYFRQWNRLARLAPRRYRRILDRYEDAVNGYGYSLRRPKDVFQVPALYQSNE